MSKSENYIQSEIRVALSQYGIVYRLNSGTFYGGKVINTPEYGRVVINPTIVKGCPEGTSDLMFIGTDGRVAWIECKDDKGKLRPEQINFIELMRSYGYRAGVARSVDDALRIINE